MNFKVPIESEFTKNGSDSPRQIERLVVIKEACGNGYVAILFWLFPIGIRALALAAQRSNNSIVARVWQVLIANNLWIALTLLVFVAILLMRMHFVHVQRQYNLTVQYVRGNLWKRS